MGERIRTGLFEMILKGDCIEVMKAMKPNSVDAVVCDPPYGLEFMGKEWDRLYPDKGKWKGMEHKPTIENRKDSPYLRSNIKQPAYLLHCVNCGGNSSGEWNRCKCESPQFKAPDKVRLASQLWHIQWLTEAYRVLKPGGSMLVMGGTRTSHRLACAIEDSGFIIKDTLMWIYGSGFPKAQDLGKMIDKRAKAKREIVGKIRRWGNSAGKGRGGQYANQHEASIIGAERIDSITASSTDLAKHWDGFKVGGIKPAYEPITWAVKSPEGSYIDNVLKWGVGAVNVDETRIGINNGDDIHVKNPHTKGGFGHADSRVFGKSKDSIQYEIKGRFPANIILDEEAGRMLDEQSGVSKSRGGIPKNLSNDRFPWKGSICETTGGLGDTGGASRFFYCAKASRSERNAGLEGMEKKECFNLGHKNNPGRNAPKKSYPRQNNHPTVKPVKLFEYLIKLVTREGQIVLDPFIGSGTTAIAAHNTGRKCMGIEKEGEYLEIAKRRIDHWKNQPKQKSLNLGG